VANIFYSIAGISRMGCPRLARNGMRGSAGRSAPAGVPSHRINPDNAALRWLLAAGQSPQSTPYGSSFDTSCRSSGGYEDFVKAITDPNDEEHGSMLVWVGGAFDPEGFDINCVNRELRRLRL